VNLEDAVNAFDVVAVNLSRLESVWTEIREAWPEGIAFGYGGPSYDDLRRSFGDLVASLPPIDGWTISARPEDPDAIAQARFEARELGEISAVIGVDREVERPGDEIAEYRFKFTKKRRQLVRHRLEELIALVDTALIGLRDRVLRSETADESQTGSQRRQAVTDPAMAEVRKAFAEINRLAGETIERKGRWSDMHRHLSFGERGDLHDIIGMDWPSVKDDLQTAMYDDREPLPVEIGDLGGLVASRPEGAVSTALQWSRLTAEDFERLIYNVVLHAPGYENVQWLIHTTAPDRGRDVSVERVHVDPLGGSRRDQVVIQCTHWLRNSVGPTDVANAITSVGLWEHPWDVLVLATSGRFTVDGVSYIERHNAERRMPRIEMWPESHLESLLASRPRLVAALQLREPPRSNTDEPF
jgi:hypothetical protein